MKKVFDQTVRDIKRGVNKKVLKVPSIEQKILDATSNEPRGPHGTHLADIAQASKNYHDYQMIMSVVWKRLNDTGKNWRHVFKGLTVLEYLVVNGSERVIEDIREHTYQISILSSFQYIDSTGRDQGSNVRKKSQSLVALVNDKEKIQEEREKAAANRDKSQNTSGGPRDEDRNGYGIEREWGDDKYGRYSEDQYGRDGFKDDEYRGRSRSNDGDNGTRSQSSDRERERAYEDDGHHSSRESNARVEDSSPDGSRLESKSSGQNLGAPPSYEDVVSEGRNPDDTPAPAPNHQQGADASNIVAPPPPAAATPPPEAATAAVTSLMENDGFDFFDPRGATPVAAPASGGAESDLLGSLSDSFSSNALALVPSVPHPPTNPNPSHTPFDDPFGDGPFKAVPSTHGFSAQPPPSPFTESSPMGNNVGFGDAFDPLNDILADILPPPGSSPVFSSQTVTLEQPGQHSTQNVFHSQNGQLSPQTGYATQSNPFSQMGFLDQSDQPTISSGFPGQFSQPISQSGFLAQGGQSILPPGFPAAQAGQSVLKPGFPEANGDQSLLKPGFPAANGGQSVLPPGFPAAQDGQPGFPATQGGQPGFPATQGGQPGFPTTQGGQPGFPATQGGQPGFPATRGGQPGFLAAQGGQSVLPPGLTEAQGGQPGFPTAQGGQPGFPAIQGGQPGFSAAQSGQPGFPTAQGGQPGFPTAQGGQPGFPSAQGGQPGFPSAQGGQPDFLAAQGGRTGFPTAQGGQPGFPSAQGGQSVLPPGLTAAQGGQPGFSTSKGGQSTFSAAQGSQPGFPVAQSAPSVLPPGYPVAQSGQSGFMAVKVDQPVLQPSFSAAQGGQSVLPLGFAGGQNASLNGFSSQYGTVSESGFPKSNGQPGQPNNVYGVYQPQGSSVPVRPLTQVTVTPDTQYNASNFYQPQAVTPSTGALAGVPQQQTKEKFGAKSTVWADTLNRGLVNLNISGSKTNPLSDIGIDFEAINRKEKRMEKPSKTPVTSNVTMGKAMGSGSGIGRAGATALRPAPNQMAGMGSGINQPMGMNNMPQNMETNNMPQNMGMNNMPRNMGMNNMPQNMGIGMNIGQGFQMQQQQQQLPAAGFPPGNYNAMVGRGGGGGYTQQPYGGFR